MSFESPQFPIGPYRSTAPNDGERRKQLIAEIAELPAQLRRAVQGLSKTQLATQYRNWTIRQIVHHLADSHINGLIRFKLALTEDHPTIKPYDESRWSQLSDSTAGELEPSLQLLEGLHARWCGLLRSMSEADFQRTYFHPESAVDVSLDEALAQYAWHGRHHSGQIQWMRKNGRV